MQIAIIGFGEAGQAFVTNWTQAHRDAARGFDIKSADPKAGMTARYTKFGLTECHSAADAVAPADIIFSLVTVDQAGIAAANAKPLKKGALFLDCNSVSPGTKRANAEQIEANGGVYVDVAVMAPVHPALNKVPLLLSGSAAPQAEEILNELGMNPTTLDGEIGLASSIKMIRSIMVKGIEALSAECVLSAVQAGIDETVLNSLAKSFPGMDWAAQSAYNLERMSVHGRRRAAEMAESVKTIKELGLPAHITQGTVKWQQMIGELDYSPTAEGYKPIADDLIKKIQS